VPSCSARGLTDALRALVTILVRQSLGRWRQYWWRHRRRPDEVRNWRGESLEM